MPKTKKDKTIFFYIGQPLYRLIFFALKKTQTTKPKKTSRIKFTHLKRSKWIYLAIALTFSCLALLSTITLKNLPDVNNLRSFPNKVSTKIFDRNGILLYQIYQDENRSLVKISDLKKETVDAFISAEDKNFYQHHGFSLAGMARAFYKNVTNEKVEGGSTITQQLVKNTLLTNEKTISRKIKELILAIKVELIFTKSEILEIYLNQIGFGGPAYGIEEASRQYFGISASELNLTQSAYLAGITRAPSKYSAFGENFDLGLERKNQVLEQMYHNGFIAEETYFKSTKEDLIFRTSKNNILAPHFVMLVRDMLYKELGESTVNYGGLTVITTLDSKLQANTQKLVSKEIANLKKLNVDNGAALITDPKNGDILAMVGSKDYFDINSQGQVNLTTSLRQPGSSIKPLNYALAFEMGKKPDDTIEDKPVTVVYNNGKTWSPKNYDGKFHGKVTLKQALANSYNIPSVLILKENGIENFAKFSLKMGITSWNEPSRFGLSMALGSLEVRMTDLATAYSAFANQGIATPLKAIKKITTHDNTDIYVPECISISQIENNATTESNNDICGKRRVINPKTASDISKILSDNQARSSAFGLNSVLNIRGHEISVKTGTSNDLRDNWTIGYNQDYLVATWVGNNDNKPMSNIASGITGASPIWNSIFTSILRQKLASN